MCDKMKKVLKVIGIIAAIATVIVGIYYLVTKVLPCKNSVSEDEETDYVSCSCCDIDDPVQVNAE